MGADDTIAAIVERTRREQGLPPRVTDPAFLAKLAALLGQSEPK